jgi:hypothetical protein
MSEEDRKTVIASLVDGEEVFSLLSTRRAGSGHETAKAKRAAAPRLVMQPMNLVLDAPSLFDPPRQVILSMSY